MIPGSQAQTGPALSEVEGPPIAKGQEAGSPAGTVQPQKLPYVPGEVLVKFKPQVSALSAQILAEQLGAREIRAFSGIGVRQVKLPKGMTVEDAVWYYRGHPDVEYAEPNYLRHALATPNDTSFGSLWGLHNTGQSVNGTTGTADADIDAPEAWDINTGSSNVIIAVIDGGVAYDHPDLTANMWTNTGEVAGDGLDNDLNGFVDDVRGWDFVTADNEPMDATASGHGTHVAGTIAAQGNNGSGVSGVMWTARLMPLRFLDASGSGSVANAVAAINYAVAKGVRIINGSYGSTTCSQTEYDAINAANTAGVLFVAAAGNSSANNDTTPHFPSSFSARNCAGSSAGALPNVISVAATTQTDTLASFSNFGASSVQVAAPGVNVFSTQPSSTLTTILSENMDAAAVGGLPAGWTSGVVSGTNNTWAVTNLASSSVPQSLTDSPGSGVNYQNNTDSFARSPNTPTTGQRGCRFTFQLRGEVVEADSDFISAEYSTDGTTWTMSTALAGSSSVFVPIGPLDLPDGKPTMFVRFRLVTDSSGVADGVYLDDVTVQCAGSPLASDLQFRQGTSMAAPHVSGVAGLIVAANLPTVLTPTQLKNTLLASVDVLSSLSGVVSTGGRINARAALVPRVTRLTCPSSLTPGSTGTCTVMVSSFLSIATSVSLSSSSTAVLTAPASVSVAANQNTATFTITGVADGTATITAGPISAIPPDNVSQTASVSVFTPSSGDNNTLCFIATAAFGSPLAPEVQVLREFRDQYLLTHAPGRLFVAAYYRLSPPLADLIREREGLKAATRATLRPVIWWAHLTETSPVLALALVPGSALGGFVLYYGSFGRRNRRRYSTDRRK